MLKEEVLKTDSANEGSGLETGIVHEKNVGQLRLALMGAFWGVRAAWYAAQIVILLPDQVTLLTRDYPGLRDSALGVTTGVAALFSIFMFPYFGLLSDRAVVRERFGSKSRRLQFVLHGLWPRLLAIVLLSVLVFPVVWLLPVLIIAVTLETSVDAIPSAAYMAMLPDSVPEKQWGAGSGWIGMAAMVGNALGAGLLGVYFQVWSTAVHEVTGAPSGEVTGAAVCGAYLVFAVLYAVGTAVTVLGAPPARACVTSHPDADDWGMVRAYAVWRPRFVVSMVRQLVAPFRSAAFCWVFVTRFLFTVGFQAILTFFKFYVDDLHNCEEAEDVPIDAAACGLFGLELTSNELAVGLFVFTVTAGSMASVLVSGFFSDRIGRKPVIFACGTLMAVVVPIFLLSPNLYITLAAGLGFGIGYGGYISVDYALVADVLPSSGDAARDMGIWHASWSVPALLAPLVGGLMLTVLKPVGVRFAYISVFGASAACLFLGAVLIFFVNKRPTR